MKGNYGDYYDGIYNAIRNDADVPCHLRMH
jgi:hypothetical protein